MRCWMSLVARIAGCLPCLASLLCSPPIPSSISSSWAAKSANTTVSHLLRPSLLRISWHRLSRPSPGNQAPFELSPRQASRITSSSPPCYGLHQAGSFVPTAGVGRSHDDKATARACVCESSFKVPLRPRIDFRHVPEGVMVYRIPRTLSAEFDPS